MGGGSDGDTDRPRERRPRSRSRSRSNSSSSHSSSRSHSADPSHRPLKRHRSSRSRSGSKGRGRHTTSRSRSRSRDRGRSRSRSRSRERNKQSGKSHLEGDNSGRRQRHDRSKSAERRKGRDRSPFQRDSRHRDPGWDRDMDRDRDRDRDRGRDGGTDRNRERDREADKDRNRGRDRERDRDREGDKDRDREGDRGGNRDRDRERNMDRDREGNRDGDRGREGDGDRDRDRRGGRQQGRDTERSRADRDRGRQTERERSRERDREEHHPTRDDDRGHKRSRWEQQQQQQQQQPLPDLHGPSKCDRGASTAGDRGDWGGANRRQPAVPLLDDPPEVGSIHAGVIQTVKPFGVFVAIDGYRRHVLVHHTQVSAEVVLTRSDEDELKVKALEYAAPPGQRVWLKILDVSPDQSGSGFRVHGSMQVVDQQDGTDLDPTGQLAAARGPGGGGGGRLSDEPPEVGSIHRGEVKRIEAYGVFVALQGYRKYGLVHASQVANYLEFSAEDSEADRKKALQEIVTVGQQVFAKVVEVGHDDRGPKIGCSMKLVDQADGTDLDPQNLRYRPRGEAGHGPPSKAPVGASAGEVKGGTVDWGYLATRPDAFGSAGYDLLGEEPAEQRGQAAAAQAGGGRGGFPPPPQQQQQRLPPVGRGRGAVVPAWMSQQTAAAPGSVPHREAGDSDAAAAMTVEEALRIVQAATGGQGKKKHKEKHKKHEKHSKHKKSKKSKHSRKRSRSRGSGSSSRDSEASR